MKHLAHNLIPFVSGAVVGSLTSILAHFLAGRRDRKGRRRAFLGYLTGWRSKLADTHYSVATFSTDYKDTRHEFRRQAAMIENDFPFCKRETFRNFASIAGGFEGDDASNQQKVVAAIDAVVEFTRMAV
jgi:hypothetical protein